MLGLLKFITISAALFSTSSSQVPEAQGDDPYTYRCLDAAEGMPSSVNAKQCQGALKKFLNQQGQFEFLPGQNFNDQCGCLILFENSLPEHNTTTIVKTVDKVTPVFQYILDKCNSQGGIGIAWVPGDNGADEVKIAVDSTTVASESATQCQANN